MGRPGFERNRAVSWIEPVVPSILPRDRGVRRPRVLSS